MKLPPRMFIQVRLRSYALKLWTDFTMSHGFSNQNSPSDLSTLTGAGMVQARSDRCDTTANHTQFQPSGSVRERLMSPQVAPMVPKSLGPLDREAGRNVPSPWLM